MPEHSVGGRPPLACSDIRAGECRGVQLDWSALISLTAWYRPGAVPGWDGERGVSKKG